MQALSSMRFFAVGVDVEVRRLLTPGCWWQKLINEGKSFMVGRLKGSMIPQSHNLFKRDVF